MPKGRKPTPEFIDAVRQFAARKMSASETGAELGVTRNAIVGMAFRNGIKLQGRNVGNKQKHPPRPRAVNPRHHYVRKPKPPTAAPTPHVVQLKQTPNFGTLAPKPAAVVANCSWAQCQHRAEPGDMFCYSHARKGLMQ